jgi:hypothetical protein
MGPTGTTKNLKKGVVWFFSKKTLKGCLHVDNTTWDTVEKKTGSTKRITPKTKRNRPMCKQRESCLNNMSMFAFSHAILLMCVWA